MSDSYKVLGVSPYASDYEISKAYKNLAKKYHPDNYTDNPLAELATEKMQEINKAYDEIKRIRRENGYNNSSSYYQSGDYAGYNSSYSGSSSQGNVKYNDVRMMIRQGRIADADQILSGVPAHMRDAEWHFLKGTVLYRKGWTEQAYENFKRACEMEPNNSEYREALFRVNSERNGQYAGYNPAQSPTDNSGCFCSGCDICTALCCADTCCECMGGDIIACC